MSELTITAANFTLQPVADLRDGPATLRWAYNRSFLDSDGVQVFAGTQSSGFGIETPCSIADGLINVDQDSLLWTTDDAQDPAPLSIWISAWLLTPRGQLIAQLTIAGKAQFVVPSSLAPTTTWSLFSNYNQAVTLAYLNPNYYTAAQIDRLVRQWMDNNPATDVALGTVLLTVPADDPDSPVVWGANDPLVRDAVKIQGVDISDTSPLDTQGLFFNSATNQYEPGNQNPGTGNVISNEVSSVDGQLTTASGTGGKTIDFYSQDGLVKTAGGGVAAPAVAATDYVAPGAVTTSGLTQATNRILGRQTAGTGAIEELTPTGTGNPVQATSPILVTPNLGTPSAAVLTNATGLPLTTGVTGDLPFANLTPASGASKLLGRGDSGAGDYQEISLGSGLSMTGTTLAASGTGGYDTVEDEGTPLTQRSTMNFVGAGVTAADSGGVTTITIPGGGGSTDVLEVQVFS